MRPFRLLVLILLALTALHRAQAQIPPSMHVLGQPKPKQTPPTPPPPPPEPAPTPQPAPQQPPNLTSGIAATPPVEVPAAPAYLPRLDEGLLDQKWFAASSLPWKTKGFADYHWAKEGLSLKDRTIAILWERPTILSGETDEWDRSVSYELQSFMPEQFTRVLSQFMPVVPKDQAPQLLLVGRTVECNVCTNLLFSAAMEVHTWDMKLIDAATGELLMALHHRTIDGWGSKGSGIKRNAKGWAQKFGKVIQGQFAE